MTWQLFSPDLPFLNQITVSQERHGVWENLLPYAPFVSACCAAVSIFVAFRIALKAQSISTEQKKIAEDKLYLDLFLKRFDAFQVYSEFFSKFISVDYKEKQQIVSDFNSLLSSHRTCLVLLRNKDDCEKCYKTLETLKNFRLLNLSIEDIFKDEEKMKRFNEINESFLRKHSDLCSSFKDHVPNVVFMKPPKTDRPSNPAPQPTGLKAFLMRLKRAACEWSRPLQ